MENNWGVEHTTLAAIDGAIVQDLFTAAINILLSPLLLNPCFQLRMELETTICSMPRPVAIVANCRGLERGLELLVGADWGRMVAKSICNQHSSLHTRIQGMRVL